MRKTMWLPTALVLWLLFQSGPEAATTFTSRASGPVTIDWGASVHTDEPLGSLWMSKNGVAKITFTCTTEASVSTSISYQGNGQITGSWPEVSYTPAPNFTGIDYITITLTENSVMTDVGPMPWEIGWVSVLIFVKEPPRFHIENVLASYPVNVSINPSICWDGGGTWEGSGSLDEIAKVSWDFGDGQTAVGAHPSPISYGTTGLKTITATVADSIDAAAVQTMTIEIIDATTNTNTNTMNTFFADAGADLLVMTQHHLQKKDGDMLKASITAGTVIPIADGDVLQLTIGAVSWTATMEKGKAKNGNSQWRVYSRPGLIVVRFQALRQDLDALLPEGDVKKDAVTQTLTGKLQIGNYTSDFTLSMEFEGSANGRHVWGSGTTNQWNDF